MSTIQNDQLIEECAEEIERRVENGSMAQQEAEELLKQDLVAIMETLGMRTEPDYDQQAKDED